jgi:hypothetical protein
LGRLGVFCEVGVLRSEAYLQDRLYGCDGAVQRLRRFAEGSFQNASRIRLHLAPARPYTSKMRLDLAQLSGRDLALALPPASAGSAERRATLVSATDLSGLFETSEAGWKLTRLACGEALLRALAWTFGKVSLASEGQARLGGLRGELEQEAGRFHLELTLEALDAVRLVLAVGALRISARVEAQGLTLRQGGGNGVLRAQRAVFREFEASSGQLRASAPELRVSDLTVDWGGDEFRFEVGAADALALEVESGGNRLHASDVELLALRSLGSRVRLGDLRLSRAELAASLGQSAAARDETEPHSAPPLDLRLLDTLAGRLDVDVEVDISVPILGRRRATHELRLGIEGGAIDYLELERGLSTLEDALLDFSVREGMLVLERALPLLSTRGRGKPLLLWDLDAVDHARAEQEGRVRISLLPEYRPAKSEGEEQDKGGGSAFKLRALSLGNLAANLSLAQNRTEIGGVLLELTFETLTLRGDVHHRPDEAPPGALRAEGAQLRAQLRDLPLAGRTGAGRLEIAVLRGVEITFEGTRATRLKGALEGFTLANLQLG